MRVIVMIQICRFFVFFVGILLIYVLFCVIWSVVMLSMRVRCFLGLCILYVLKGLYDFFVMCIIFRVKYIVSGFRCCVLSIYGILKCQLMRYVGVFLYVMFLSLWVIFVVCLSVSVIVIIVGRSCGVWKWIWSVCVCGISWMSCLSRSVMCVQL